MNKTGVSQKAVILNKKSQFLIIQRSATAPSNPHKWDLPGGDLDFGENPVEGILREIKEETSLIVKEIKPFDIYSNINDIGDFWVTIAYVAEAVSEKVNLSYEHNDFKWVTVKEFSKLKSPDKIKQFINNLPKSF